MIRLLLLAAVLHGSAAAESVLRVPSDEHPTIQSAVDAASDGDTVLVAAGVYRENISVKNKSIKLKSISGPRETVIDGASSGCVVQFSCMGESKAFLLHGFSVLNGTGSQKSTHPLMNRMKQRPGKGNKDGPLLTGTGGGIHCFGGTVEIRGNIIAGNSCLEAAGMYLSSTCVVRDNVIAFNLATKFGGGLWLDKCSATITNNYILSNVGSRNGGGIYCYTGEREVTVTNNLFMDNWSFYGGGINVTASSPKVMNNIFYKNMGCRGGAVLCINKGASAVIRDNLMEHNWGCYGAGVCSHFGASPRIVGNVIHGNTTHNPYCIQAPQRVGGDYSGGGLFFWESGPSLVEGNIICYNTAELRGGGIGCICNSSPLIVGNTVFGNIGETDIGGLYCDETSNPEIINTIFWNNEPVEISGGNPTLRGCNVQGGWPGEGNVDLPPGFTDEGDFHLCHDSPLRDAGVDVEVLTGTDFEGDPRRVGKGMDIGADEFMPSVILTEEPGFRRLSVEEGMGVLVLDVFSRDLGSVLEDLEQALPEVTSDLPRWYDTPKAKPFNRTAIDRLLDAFTGEDAKIPLPSPAFATGAVPIVAQQLVWNPEGLEVTQAPAMLGFSLVWIPVGKEASGGWGASGRTGKMLLVP